MTGPTLTAADWPAAAACGGKNSRTFVEAGPAEAKEICGGCPVRAECLYDALVSKATNGIWGGLTYHERRTLPVLPADRTAAVTVLRQLPVPPAPSVKASTPAKPKTPPRRKKPLAQSGPAPTVRKPRQRAEVLAEHVEPYGDGHARWTGPMSGRLPQLYAENTRFNARHAVFEQHHGRPPAGRVRSNCGVTACISGPHLTDDILRAVPPKKEPPVTVQALKNLLGEIDEQGGPQAARDNRLHLPNPTVPTAEEPMTNTAEPATPDLVVQPAVVVRPPVITSLSEAVPVEDLLTWGDEHPDPEVRDQAARARTVLAGLRARHAADQELTEIATEAAQLEQRLAQLRAREAELAPGKKPTPARKTEPKPKTSAKVRGHDAAAVRAWAAANGVDCPRFGKIPQRVLDAWREATTPAGGAG